LTTDTGPVLQRARQMLDGAAPVPADADDALLLAWALKQLCYEAWSSEPPRAALAARALHALHAAGVPPAQALEVEALARWTAGIACLTRGEMAEAVLAFDTAADGFRRAGRPDPAAQTQVPKIMALSMLGQHAQAAACAESTQRELLALGNLSVAARVSQNLGSLHLRRDAYPEAARHYREAAALFARLGDRTHGVLADIGMAEAVAALGDFDEALRLYARAGADAAELGLETSLALVHEAVARLHLARGRWRDALAGLESACRRYEALGMPQLRAIAERHLGDVYLELRLLPEALALFDTAGQRYRALALPDEQAWALAQQGRAQALLAQDAAAESFAAAAAVFAAQGNSVGAAAVTLARAELALAAGDASAALDWAAAAQTAFGAAGQADGGARADVIHARALLAAGRVDEAGAAFDATLARARALRQVHVQVRCLTGQGLVAQAQGDAARASALFDVAIERFEDQRRALPDDALRSAFLTDHLRPYQEQLRAALAGGDGAQVLWQLDRFRARALGERLAEPGTVEPGAQALAPLRTRLNWLYRQVQRQQDEGAASPALDAELLHTEHELLESARRQRLTAPARAGAGAGGFEVRALCGALAPGDALVEYGVQDDELFACVASADGVTLVRSLASWREALDAVRATRFQLETLRHGVAPVRAHLPTLATRLQLRLARLHALVWAPLAAALHGAQRVLVVPHAQLGALPFAALPDAGLPLGQRMELALAPSASAALRGLRRPPVAARRVLALAESSRLPHAAREAAAVATLFTHGRACIGAQATLAALRDGAAAADVLHLACHAQFRSDNPRFSALHLHDQALTVDLAEGLGLQACTVVLSACESGLAEVGVGDESVGLVRAFLVAGAARVVASLWPVDDESTLAFMTRFHVALAGGQGPAAALRQAQAATRSEQPHPYFWAAFTVHGGW
jgi:tetratricopeptide (TPR) repeat protein